MARLGLMRIGALVLVRSMDSPQSRGRGRSAPTPALEPAWSAKLPNAHRGNLEHLAKTRGEPARASAIHSASARSRRSGSPSAVIPGPPVIAAPAPSCRPTVAPPPIAPCSRHRAECRWTRIAVLAMQAPVLVRRSGYLRPISHSEDRTGVREMRTSTARRQTLRSAGVIANHLRLRFSRGRCFAPRSCARSVTAASRGDQLRGELGSDMGPRESIATAVETRLHCRLAAIRSRARRAAPYAWNNRRAKPTARRRDYRRRADIPIARHNIARTSDIRCAGAHTDRAKKRRRRPLDMLCADGARPSRRPHRRCPPGGEIESCARPAKRRPATGDRAAGDGHQQSPTAAVLSPRRCPGSFRMPTPARAHFIGASTGSP